MSATQLCCEAVTQSRSHTVCSASCPLICRTVASTICFTCYTPTRVHRQPSARCQAYQLLCALRSKEQHQQAVYKKLQGACMLCNRKHEKPVPTTRGSECIHMVQHGMQHDLSHAAAAPATNAGGRSAIQQSARFSHFAPLHMRLIASSCIRGRVRVRLGSTDNLLSGCS